MRESPPAPAEPSLRTTAVRGSFFELAGFGGSQALRLASNIVLSRLLFPEAFGLATLMTLFLQGLAMLTDVGIQQSVIQNERGDDPRFLNTAWTMQVVRGAILCGVAGLLAYPMSRFYGEPVLFPLYLMGGVQLFVSSLHSTSVFTLRRRVALGWVVGMDLGSHVVNIVVMIAWAMVSPTVWALAVGGMVSTICHVAATHLVPVGYRNRLHWDPTARREITNFGRWIFGSSALSFLARQGDRLLLGRFMGAASLGIYTIAVMISEAAGTVTERITGGVLYPLFSRVGRQGIPALRDLYYKARLRLDLLTLPALGVLTMVGDFVVRLIWDPRYEEAGWMLRVLCVRVALACLIGPCETCLSAMGKPRYGFVRNVAKTAAILVGIPLGFHFGGIEGLVWATAICELASFVVLWPPFWAAGMLRIRRELLAVALYAAGILVGALVRRGLLALFP